MTIRPAFVLSVSFPDQSMWLPLETWGLYTTIPRLNY